MKSYYFMTYMSATQEVAYQGLVDYYGNGKLIESTYIKIGVTTERRLIDRPKETSRTITGAAVPLLGINVRVDLIEQPGAELPSYEQTREAFERDFRDCLPDCFTNGYIPSEAAGECGFAPYIELTDIEKSKNFLRKLDISINKIRKRWKKDYEHLGIINIHPIWIYKYDDLSRAVLEIFKEYKIDKNKSSINQLRHKERIQDVVEKITSTKLIRLINSGDLRIETDEVSGITSLEGLLTGEKLVKPKRKSLYWRATRDQENGKNYITYVTEVNVGEDGKVGFEDTERDGGKTYDLEEFNKNFFDPNNEPVSINPRTQSRARQVLKALETNPRACIVMCCGTGKSYIAAMLVRSGYFKRIIVISPADILLEKTREVIGDWYNVDYITYQSLANRSIESLSGYDLIIFDEAHRLGAPDWSNNIECKLFPANPNAKVLGMTATPIRYDGINIVDRYFNGVSVVDLTFPKAWSNGELPPPTIVEAIVDPEEEVEEKLEAIKNCSKIDELERDKISSGLNNILVDWKNSGGIPEILRQYLPTSTERIIVFLDSIDYLEEMEYRVADWFIEMGRTPITYKIHSRNSRKTNLLSLNEFEDSVDNGYIKVLLSVNMFNEGYHIPGVESVIFLRRTGSSRIVEQEMGRCMSPSNKNPTVFDFVGNYIRGEFDYISKWKNDLDREETKKILRGEKTEKDRITIKVVDSFVLKIQEIFEIADKLNNSIIYYLQKLEKYKENGWKGLSPKEDKPCYRFVSRYRDKYDICAEAWRNISRNVEYTGRKIMPIEMVRDYMFSKGFDIYGNLLDQWINFARNFESEFYYIPANRESMRKHYGTVSIIKLFGIELCYTAQETLEILKAFIKNLPEDKSIRTSCNSYIREHNNTVKSNKEGKFMLTTRILETSSGQTFLKLLGKDQQYLPFEETICYIAKKITNLINFRNGWIDVAAEYNKISDVLIYSEPFCLSRATGISVAEIKNLVLEKRKELGIID